MRQKNRSIIGLAGGVKVFSLAEVIIKHLLTLTLKCDSNENFNILTYSLDDETYRKLHAIAQIVTNAGKLGLWQQGPLEEKRKTQNGCTGTTDVLDDRCVIHGGSSVSRAILEIFLCFLYVAMLWIL